MTVGVRVVFGATVLQPGTCIVLAVMTVSVYVYLFSGCNFGRLLVCSRWWHVLRGVCLTLTEACSPVPYVCESVTVVFVCPSAHTGAKLELGPSRLTQ